MRQKVESFTSEAKIVRIGAERRKIFPRWPEKGTNRLSFSALEGKIEQRIWISARKRPRGTGLLKQPCPAFPALTLSIQSCDKHLQTPQKRYNRTDMDNRSQVSVFSLSCSKQQHFFSLGDFILRYFKLHTNTFYSAQILSYPKCNTTLRTLGGHVPRVHKSLIFDRFLELCVWDACDLKKILYVVGLKHFRLAKGVCIYCWFLFLFLFFYFCFDWGCLLYINLDWRKAFSWYCAAILEN